MSSGKKITLKSSDGQTFEVDEAVALESQIIKHMIEDGCADNIIPLPNVTSKILSKVIKYCEKHVEAPKTPACADNVIWLLNVISKILSNVIKYCKKHVEGPGTPAAADDRSTSPDDDLKTWDAEFVKVDPATLFDLIQAANYLNIKSLLDLTCQTVADRIKGIKTPEHIPKMFRVRDDSTPEEEEEVRREKQWAFE